MTTDVGAGLFGFGAWPAGFGMPATSTPLPSAPFPLFDGLLADGRGLDWIVGDYRIGQDGSIIGAPGTGQRMLLAFVTTLGSSVLPTLGNSLASIKTITADINQRIEDAVRFSAFHIVSSGAASIESVTFSPRLVAGRVDFRTLWRDLSTGSVHAAVATR